MLTECEAGHYIRPIERCGSAPQARNTAQKMKKNLKAGQGKPNEPMEKRCYRSYNSGGELEFCPMKDLNLPESYEEVLARFEKLQGDRAMEVLN